VLAAGVPRQANQTRHTGWYRASGLALLAKLDGEDQGKGDHEGVDGDSLGQTCTENQGGTNGAFSLWVAANGLHCAEGSDPNTNTGADSTDTNGEASSEAGSLLDRIGSHISGGSGLG